MLYILESFFYILAHGVGRSVSFVLFMLLFVSSISAYLVGWSADFDGIHLLYVMYTAVLIYILFNSYEGYSNLKTFNSNINRKRLLFLEKVSSIIGVVTLLLNLFILYKVFNLLIIGTVYASNFKNGLAEEFISEFIPYYMVTVSNLLSPLGYFFLSLHFYYLFVGKKKRTIFYFILSLLIPSNGMLLLSRSSTVEYILLYSVLLFVLLPLINKRFKKSIMRAILVFLGIVVFGFWLISSNRFSDGYENELSRKAILNPNDSPVLYSFMDYFGQWQHYSLLAMDAYKPEEKGWGLYNCSGLAIRIANKTMGSDNFSSLMNDKIEKTMGKGLASAFHGVILRLVYDFGFIGAFIFVFAYGKVVRKYSPSKGVLTFTSLIMLPVVLPIGLLFFAGNAFSSLTLDMGFIYNFMILYYIKHQKFCINRNTNISIANH